MDSFALFDRHLERVIQTNSLMASSTQTNNFLNHLLKKGGGFNQNMNNGLPTGGGLIHKIKIKEYQTGIIQKGIRLCRK